MKVTVLIDDNILKEAMKYSKTSTITETLKLALNEYVSLRKLKELSKIVKNEPLNFILTADEIRNLNREE
jgi:Arc/MetJ family transcription regulator